MYNPHMNLQRTPLLFEARGQTRHAHHKAADLARFRGGKKGKKSLIKRLRKGRKKLPHSYSAATREMDAPPTMPRIGMAVAGPGSFGPVGVGGIMRHS